jgi:hypothetical protein
MKTQALSPETARHRLLEGVLLRLARRADVGDFVVRGGILMHHWFRPARRPVEDLDLVATFAFDVEQAAARFLAVLANEAPDGVAFDAEEARAEGIWLDTGSPGVRIFATGIAGGTEADFHVDLTFGPFPRPAPVFGALPTACGEAARVWMCRPEAVAGHKVQALWHRGMLGWRPKDLEDLRLLARLPMDEDDLRGAIAAYLADIGAGGDEARALFGPSSWWGMKLCSARWLDFVKSARGQDVPGNLAAVVTEVVGRLAPVLEGLP